MIFRRLWRFVWAFHLVIGGHRTARLTRLSNYLFAFRTVAIFMGVNVGKLNRFCK